MVWLIVAIVGVVVMAAFTVHQVKSKQPLPGEENAIAGVGDWVTFVDPNRAFSIDFPVEPSVGDEQTSADRRSRQIEARVLRVWYAVEYYDFFSGFTGGVYGENFLDRRAGDYASDVGGTLNWSQRGAVAGLPASEFVVDSPTGVHHVAAVLTGKRLYFFTVIATVDAPKGYARFVASFKPMAPDS
jgi:hypothetical protein